MSILIGVFIHFILITAHDFHLSKTDIAYDLDRHRYEMTMHIFINDLGLGIKASGVKDKLFLATNNEDPRADSIIAAYIKDHFSFIVDENRVQLEFLGKEMSDDYSAFWIYMQSEKTSIPHHSLIVRNALLTDVYDDQQNILILDLPRQQKKHFIFRKGYLKQTILP